MLQAPAHQHTMILSLKICLKELSDQGKSFNWEPQGCEKCRRPMWGHGFVSRYFAEMTVSLYLKRFRCPGCRSVLTTRPSGYWPRIRSSVVSIYTCLRARLDTGGWPSGGPRQRYGHWLRRFGRKVRMDFNHAPDLSQALEFCLSKSIPFFT